MKAGLKHVVPAAYRPAFRAAYFKTVHFGLKHRCPFCKSRLRSFLPFGLDAPVFRENAVVGGGYRQNARCPVCGSIDRERLLYLFLREKTDLFEAPTRLLHVAPEREVEAMLRDESTVDYLTADIASDDVMVRMDITDIDFPDAYFDAIICNHVLEHVIDDRRAMAELFRALRPGGWAILQVPLSPRLVHTYEDFSITGDAEREAAFGQVDHVRIYGLDYQQRLAQAGFTVTMFSWPDDAERFGGKRNVFGLNVAEVVYFAEKGR